MMLIFHILHWMAELYIIYLAIMGTWRLAQSTKEQGTIANISENQRKEKEYAPIKDLNPFKIFAIIKWFFSQRRREDTKKNLNILIKPTIIY